MLILFKTVTKYSSRRKSQDKFPIALDCSERVMVLSLTETGTCHGKGKENRNQE